MNENRGVFALDGVTGYLIAVVLLLSILAGLTVWGIGVQQANATTYYSLDANKLVSHSADNVNLYHEVKK